MNRVSVGMLFIGLMLSLSACSNSNNFAPVTDGWSNSSAASQTYHVQSDDTLYSIAFRYGLDYRQLAAANHISPPYHIVTGQTLVLLPEADDTLTTSQAPNGNTPSGSVVTGGAPQTAVISSPVSTTTVSKAQIQPGSSASASSTTTSHTVMAAPTGPVKQWIWPADGKVIHTFSDAYGGNKGIDIAGTSGEPVRATAAGRVVYCGSGLRGYGLLIIIKHNNEYLSAYAHCSKAYVKEGDVVTSGQTIAAMGSTDSPQVMLHFEIRDAGKPVDPMTYLPSKQG